MLKPLCLPSGCRCVQMQTSNSLSCFRTLVIKDAFCSPCNFFFFFFLNSLCSFVNSAFVFFLFIFLLISICSLTLLCVYVGVTDQSGTVSFTFGVCSFCPPPALVPCFVFWCIHMLVSFWRLQSTKQYIWFVCFVQRNALIWFKLLFVSFMANLVWGDYRRPCSYMRMNALTESLWSWAWPLTPHPPPISPPVLVTLPVSGVGSGCSGSVLLLNQCAFCLWVQICVTPWLLLVEKKKKRVMLPLLLLFLLLAV